MNWPDAVVTSIFFVCSSVVVIILIRARLLYHLGIVTLPGAVRIAAKGRSEPEWVRVMRATYEACRK